MGIKLCLKWVYTSTWFLVNNCFYQTKMDFRDDSDYDNLLNFNQEVGFDHPFEPLGFHNPEHIEEEQKVAMPIPKRKGRPKGLKTNRIKSEGKEERRPGGRNSGHWQEHENKKYHWFLQIYSKHFIHRHMRRMDKIFKTMSDFIGTREAQQCRSHHQKMQKKHQTFYRILKWLRNEFYSSIEPSHVRNDLQSNNIFDYDPLINSQTLENQRETESHVAVPDSNLELEPEKPSREHNFFTQDYESRLNYN